MCVQCAHTFKLINFKLGETTLHYVSVRKWLNNINYKTYQVHFYHEL